MDTFQKNLTLLFLGFFMILIFGMLLVIIPREPRISILEKQVEGYANIIDDKDLEILMLRSELNSLKLELQDLNNIFNERSNIPYRLTSYWTGDSTGSTSCTGSGICTKSFSVNNKGWYTYNGYLVLAGATNECLRSSVGSCREWSTPVLGKHYFNYYDKVYITIDGVRYRGIILDSCGSCMDSIVGRVDLFVQQEKYMIDRGYKGVNPVTISW